MAALPTGFENSLITIHAFRIAASLLVIYHRFFRALRMRQDISPFEKRRETQKSSNWK